MSIVDKLNIVFVSGLDTLAREKLTGGVGCENWPLALNADRIKFDDVPKSNLSKYDLLFLNVDQNTFIVSQIKQAGFTGKIIGKTEKWINEWKKDVDGFKWYIKNLRSCDALICHYTNRDYYFYSAITDKPVYKLYNSFIPEIYNVKKENIDKNLIALGVGGVRYNRDNFHNVIVFKHLKEKLKHLKGVLIGTRHDGLTKEFLKNAGLDDLVSIGGWRNREEWIRYLSKFNLMIHITDNITTGRMAIDAANLKVPFVGVNSTVMWEQCYSKFYNINPFDYKKAVEISLKLLNDKTYRQEMIEYAYEKMQQFKFDNFKKDLLQIVDDFWEKNK